MPTIQSNELDIIKSFIKSGDHIIDIGGNHGDWTNAVAELIEAPVIVDIYEANPSLIEELSDIKAADKFMLHIRNYAVSDLDKTGLDFWIYSIDGMSGLHRRDAEEEKKFNAGLPEPVKVKVNSCKLDDMYDSDDERIDFIKIDTEGNELPILRGMQELIDCRCVKTIQFEYGLCWKEQGYKLQEAFELLKNYPFIYRLPENTGIIPVIGWNDNLEDYVYSNFVFSKEKL